MSPDTCYWCGRKTPRFSRCPWPECRAFSNRYRAAISKTLRAARHVHALSTWVTTRRHHRFVFLLAYGLGHILLRLQDQAQAAERLIREEAMKHRNEAWENQFTRKL